MFSYYTNWLNFKIIAGVSDDKALFKTKFSEAEYKKLKPEASSYMTSLLGYPTEVFVDLP